MTTKINKIKERKRVGAVCPKCKSPDYIYDGRANADQGEYWQLNGKHQFHCNSCGKSWQTSKNNNEYTKLI